MATPSTDADNASRTILSPSSTSAAAATAPADDTQRRPADPIQLSAADCSVGDDSGAVASSVAFGVAASTSAEHIPSSTSSQHPPPPPPPFEPLFALLTNATTGATVHPRIHYLFSDDDASIPTDATAQDDDDQQHRSLVVDLAPTPAYDAWAVSCASSLGPEFAVTAAALSKQQSDGGSSSGAPSEQPSRGSSGGGAAALMLHVEGVSRDPVDLRSSAEAVGSAGSLRSSTGSGSAAREDLEALADDFRRRMGILKKVVGEGEKRRAVVAHQHGDDDAGVAAAAAAESHEIHDPGTLRSGTASQSHDASTNT
ncbi:hypothetical protein LEL_01271 [Akanthomyces lecanii RCEF 1005]|uniref:Uncharacterized protein n=1 Tax=Akanthomyces lecanii RCEF 1005 TaxID=1081108 RepID=A0A162KNJ8_CORDF|nr:hypothetical protein LEL_01271 [Akanthomyces lecanii RCEF 1005]